MKQSFTAIELATIEQAMLDARRLTGRPFASVLADTDLVLCSPEDVYTDMRVELAKVVDDNAQTLFRATSDSGTPLSSGVSLTHVLLAGMQAEFNVLGERDGNL